MSEQRRNSPPFVLLVGGDEYSGWTSMRVTRGLERACSDFELSVSERWGLEDETWQIQPGESCEIRFEDETVLTGWVDKYGPSYDASSHSIRLNGRSKTCDFVDSSILMNGGQFNGLTVGQIARQLAQPFGLEVIVDKDGPPEADVQVQQGETNFALVERLCRLQELLITDDNLGRLVLCRAGAGSSSTALTHGENIKTASADLDWSQRFSDYIVKAQRAGNNKKAKDNATKPPGMEWNRSLVQLRSIPNISERFRARMDIARARGGGKKNPKALTQVGGSVKDPGVTRYRPHVIIAETQCNAEDATKRAEWEMRRRLAKAMRATISVNGWRQEDGKLWATNLMVECDAPWLGNLDRELIIATVTYNYDEAGGEMTSLEMTLPDAFLPDAKRVRKARAKAAGGKKAGKKKKGKVAAPGMMWNA